MSDACFCEYRSPLGRLRLLRKGDSLVQVAFDSDTLMPAPLTEPTHDPLLGQTVRQLEEYFVGTRRHFTLPIALDGTLFQRRVWQALGTIPWGETRSYGQLAALVGSPRAYRAVGHACHLNPLPILLPCHRILSGSGGSGGYRGGVWVQAALLAREGAALGIPSTKPQKTVLPLDE